MPSLTQVKKPPIIVTVNGQNYELPVLRLSGLRAIQQWLDARPSPLDRAAAYAGKLPEPLKDQVLAEAKEAMANWPPMLGSREAMPFIESVDGVDTVIRLMLRQSQPGLTDAQIESIAGDMDLIDIQSILAHALGLGGDDEDADPKAEAPAA